MLKHYIQVIVLHVRSEVPGHRIPEAWYHEHSHKCRPLGLSDRREEQHLLLQLCGHAWCVHAVLVL